MNGKKILESVIKIQFPNEKELKRNNTITNFFVPKVKNEMIKVISDSESGSSSHSEDGYQNFVDDYKKYYKTSKKLQKKNMSNESLGADISLMMGKANNYYIENRFDDAIALLHKIVTLSPELKEPYQTLSMIYEERGNISQALSFLMLAAQLSHGESEIWIRCANLNKQIKNLQQTDYCLSRALKILKDNEYLLYERASIHEELGNYKKAAIIYEKILKISPNIEILYHISEIYEKLNFIDRSIQILENNFDKNFRKLKLLMRLFDLYLKYERYKNGYFFYNKIKEEKDIDNINIINNSHIRIRYLFICLELSLLKDNLNKSEEDENDYDIEHIKSIILRETRDPSNSISNPDNFIKPINQNLSSNNLNSEYDDFTNSNNVIKEDEELHNLPEINTIIDEIILEFQRLNSEIEMENNIDLLQRLFIILQKSDKIEKFILMYENFDINTKRREENAFELNTWGQDSNYLLQFTPEINSKIGEYYLNDKNYTKAIDFFTKCLKNMSENKKGKDLNTSEEVLIRFKLSEIYKLLGDYNSALDILNSNNFENESITLGNNLRPKLVSNNKEVDIGSRLYDKNSLETDLDAEVNLEENIDRDFIKNQIEMSDEEPIDIESENYDEVMNLRGEMLNQNLDSNRTSNFNKRSVNDNFTFPIPIKLNRDLSHKDKKIKPARRSSISYTSELNSGFENSILHKKEFLGKKRIRLRSLQSNLNNNTIDNMNFENYLRRRNSIKSTDSNVNSLIKTINSLKFEYEELNEEINTCKRYYIKLQESLIYLQTNEMDKFLENSFQSLRQILIYELKIEDFKNQLFHSLLEKSHIKNYFKIKETAFDDFKLKNKFNEDEENYPNDYLNENELNYNLDGKDSLIVRKSDNTRSLLRKKIRKSMDLVEKQIDNFQNIDKFISPDNFLKIITKFVSHSYNKKKYNELTIILQLLLNSDYFNQRNDYILFNMQIYALLTNIRLSNYKTCFVMMKKIIVQYELKDFSIFWIFLNALSKNMNISVIRSYLYKMSISGSLVKNVYLNTLLGNCYLQTSNHDICIRHLEIIKNSWIKDDPFLYFQLGLNHLLKSMSRNNKNKLKSLMNANDNFGIYERKRATISPIEVLFNMGRVYQFVGHDQQALEKYSQLISKMHINFNNILDDANAHDEIINQRQSVYVSCIYNYALLMKKLGNEKDAHDMIMNNIIIE